MTHMNALGDPQHDVMDIEVPGRGSARQSDSEIDPDIRVDHSVPRGVESLVEIREIQLEKIDLKEEVLRSLAELHSGLLANLNLVRDVSKRPCKHTARVSLGSSQRNADGRTEEYNFLIGRMLNKAETFVSILKISLLQFLESQARDLVVLHQSLIVLMKIKTLEMRSLRGTTRQCPIDPIWSPLKFLQVRSP